MNRDMLWWVNGRGRLIWPPWVWPESAASDPARCAPRGAAVTVLKRERLGDLGVDEVAAAAGLDGGPGGAGTSET